MANHKSALKRVRQNEKRRLRNKIQKTRIKNITKDVKQAAAQSPEQAQEALKTAMATINTAAGKGALHRKTASRKIARLSRLAFKAQAGDSA